MARRLARDFGATMGNCGKSAAGLGARFWALIADKNDSILAHYTPYDIGQEMGSKTGYPYPRLWPRKRAPLIPNDRSAISGRPWGYRGHATANPGGALSGP